MHKKTKYESPEIEFSKFEIRSNVMNENETKNGDEHEIILSEIDAETTQIIPPWLRN